MKYLHWSMDTISWLRLGDSSRPTFRLGLWPAATWQCLTGRFRESHCHGWMKKRHQCIDGKISY